MATKAEAAKYDEQRSGAKKAKRAQRPHRKISEIKRALLGESVDQRHVGVGFLNRRDRSKSTARKSHSRRHDYGPRASLSGKARQSS